MSATIDKIKDLLAKTNVQGAKGGAITGKVKLDNLSDEVMQMMKNQRKVSMQYPDLNVSVDLDDTVPPVFWEILDDLNIQNNVFLVGEAGTGKTTLAEKLAFAKAGLNEKDFKLPDSPTKQEVEAFRKKIPFATINCNQWTSPARLIGGQTIDGYMEGDMIKAWEQGKMLILDEMPKLDPNTAGVLNDALAKSAKDDAIIFSGEGRPVKKHPDFCVVATGNTTGKSTSLKYGGNNQQDASLIDRFSGSYYFIEFNKDLEQSLTFQPVFEIFNKMREQLIALESDEIITLRTMLNANRAYQLEMERALGNVPNDNKGNSKTLQSTVESFLAAMDPDQVASLKKKINFSEFYNRYKNLEGYNQDKKRFNIK